MRPDFRPCSEVGLLERNNAYLEPQLHFLNVLLKSGEVQSPKQGDGHVARATPQESKVDVSINV